MSWKERDVETVSIGAWPQQMPGAQQQVFSLIFNLPRSI
jgi:hypothetical protein